MTTTTSKLGADMTDDTIDAVSKALRRAWQLGQTYWQQADSDSYKQQDKSDETRKKFEALVDETRAILARQHAAIGKDAFAEYRRGVKEAFHLANMINANRQGRTAEETCSSIVRVLAEMVNSGDARAASTSANVAHGAEAVAYIDPNDLELLREYGAVSAELHATPGNVNTKALYFAAPPAQTALTDAARDVLAERCRQVEAEGFTTARDDGYADGQLAQAGAAYALAVADHTNHTINSGAAFYTRSPDIWPWSEKWWKPTSPRRALVKAGALILAEIERLDRRALTAAQSASRDTK